MRNTTSRSIHVAIDKNYDSEFCSSIPLHLVNLIQPHGLLLVLDKTDFRIIQASQLEPNGKSYHPRHSFATYQETVKLTSLPWAPEEMETAAALRSAVLEKIVRDNY